MSLDASCDGKWVIWGYYKPIRVYINYLYLVEILFYNVA